MPCSIFQGDGQEAVIPFASQRAEGQDLATHLLNEHDNELMEVADIRGAISQDLHGAFAEWEAQARALTKCENYLYSFSVNPDHRQGQLTREQYFDYLERVEIKLGLTHQPRAVVFHIKDEREHCHAIYSRIDAENEKAVHMAFDYDKLMMVTRGFAQDHNLKLPDGYSKNGKGEKTKQLSLYEKSQQDITGITKEERAEIVTDCWRKRDSAKSFVASLESHGYVLATGNRPYVLLDIYGGMNSLPKLINDKDVKTKDIKDFLDKDFPLDSLPDVDDARKLIQQHKIAHKDHQKSEAKHEKLEQLKESQSQRRNKLETEFGELKTKQKFMRNSLDSLLRSERADQKNEYLRSEKQVKEKRLDNRPTGLTAFLAKASGFNILQQKFHEHQDRQRLSSYEADRTNLREQQNEQSRQLQQQHDMQSLDKQRQIRALALVEQRETKSLKTSMQKTQNVASNKGLEHMPRLSLNLSPPGRRAQPYVAKNRYANKESKPGIASGERASYSAESLSQSFERASADKDTSRGSGRPASDTKSNKPRKR